MQFGLYEVLKDGIVNDIAVDAICTSVAETFVNEHNSRFPNDKINTDENTLLILGQSVKDIINKTKEELDGQRAEDVGAATLTGHIAAAMYKIACTIITKLYNVNPNCT